MTQEAAQSTAERTDLALDVMLLAMAGFVDAVALVRLGVFVSFASGNSTRFAALPSQGRLGEAAAAGGLVALFVMGAFAGRLVALSAGIWRRPALLSIVAALLAFAAAVTGLGHGVAVTLGAAAMALGMGLQNSVLHQAGGVRAAPTYVTGTLVSLGHALADAMLGLASPWSAYLLMWLGLLAGAALGALGAGRYGAGALILPAAAAALLALRLGGQVRRGQAGQGPS